MYPRTTEEIRYAIADTKARRRRARLLELSDYRQMPDYPDDGEKALWAVYRQYLRDITSAEGYPEVEVKTFDQWKDAES